MINVTIILPERSEDALSEGLRLLTEHLVKLDKGDGGDGLGGKGGYGVEFENDTFMMHPFCWCEQEDCPWCGGCSCPDDAHHYYVDGVETDFQGWMDFYMRLVYGMTEGEMKARGIRRWDPQFRFQPEKANAANARRSESHEPMCDYCQGKGIFAGNGALPGRGAPNFWYKPTGFRVWWYKWIGRSMEEDGEIDGIADMIRACMQSVEAKAA
jgi:hypothetical protein